MSREGWRPRRRRDLSPEERSLWARVAETVRPLSGRAVPPPPEPGAEPPPKQPVRKTAPAAKPVAAPKKPPPLAPLEPRLARNLKRGAPVDARLDLHGLRQSEAHQRLLRFLRAQQAKGARVVLVITGKGKAGAEERGVLRRLVPAWLAEPALREVVIGFSEASAVHGGAGALYVRLRRAR